MRNKEQKAQTVRKAPRSLAALARQRGAAKRDAASVSGSAVAGGGAEPPAKQRKHRLRCQRCGTEAVDDGSNWAATEENERGRVVPSGEACKACDDFARATPYKTVADLAKVKDQKEVKALEQDREQFHEQREGGEMDYPREGVDFVTACGSRYEERVAFLTRAAFKDRYGMFPDEAKLDQLRVLTRQGEEVQGVLLSPVAPPEVVVWSEKVWMRKRHRLEASQNAFKRQASLVYDHAVRDFTQNYGQAAGGKYQAKLKQTKNYSEQEIDEAVARASCLLEEKAGDKSGLAELGGGRKPLRGAGRGRIGGRGGGAPLVEGHAGSEGSGDEEDGESEDGEKSSAAELAETPMKAGPGVASAFAAGEAATPITPGPRSIARSPHENDGPRHRIRAKSSVVPSVARSGSPSALSKKAGSGAGGASTTAAGLSDSKQRTKSASNWLISLTVSGVFCGLKYTLGIVWAEDCIAREVRAGQGLNPEAHRLELRLADLRKALRLYDLSGADSDDADRAEFKTLLQYFVNQGADFPTEMKQRLLGRRLKELLAAICDDGSKASVDAFLAGISPLSKNDDHGGEACGDEAAGGAVDMSVAAFDPAQPRVSSKDGSLIDRFSMMNKVLVYDVLRPLVTAGEAKSGVCLTVARGMVEMLESAAESLDEIPDALEEMLNICRALKALLDVTAVEVDTCAVGHMVECFKSNSAGPLADIAVFIYTTEFYKGLMDDFARFTGTVSQSMEMVGALIEEVDSMGMSLSKFVPQVNDFMKRLQSLQPNVRMGSTTLLERKTVGKCQELHEHLLAAMATGTLEEAEFLPQLSDSLAYARTLWLDVGLAQMAEWVTSKSSALAEDRKWQDVVDMLSKAFDGNNIVEGGFAALAKSLTEVMDRAPPVATASIFLDWSSRLADHMVGIFPDGAAFVAPLSSVASSTALTDKVKGGGVASMVSCLKATHEAHNAAATFEALGATVVDRAEVDKVNNEQGMKSLLQKVAKLRSCMEDFSTEGDDGIVLKLVLKKLADIDHLIDSSADYAVKTTEEKLRRTCTVVKPESLGGTDGASWTATLSQTATYQEAMQHAQKTLMKIPAARLKEQKAELTSLLQEYKRVTGLYSKTTDETLLKDSSDAIDNLQLTTIEGFLVQAFSAQNTSAKGLRNIVANIKSTVQADIWGRIAKRLSERAIAAHRLKAL